jgi:pSer/pThr/pTyr-binding forkhead associated (FHA) protein
MSLSAKLVVVGGDVKTTEIKLRLPSTIGRGRGTTIMLPHPLVSRQHCELYEDGGRLMVRDLGSLNGTFVNNERINEAPLGSGELLTIGTVTFRAVYESSDIGPPEATALPTKSKVKPQDATVRATPKQQPPSSAGEEPEFDFGQPLIAPDSFSSSSAQPSGDKHPTDRLPPPEEKPSKPAAPGAAAKSSSAAKSHATAGKPSPPKKGDDKKGDDKKGDDKKTDEATVDYSKWADEDEEKVASASDDDLNDFLKSLGSK